jgi:hypothetical protein
LISFEGELQVHPRKKTEREILFRVSENSVSRAINKQFTKVKWFNGRDGLLV